MSGEASTIVALKERFGGARRGVEGIGDDGVLLRTTDGRVVVADAMVEGVHFDARFSSPADVGFKALAVNVSDLWAMGAEPTAWMLTLGVGADRQHGAFVDGLMDGFGAAIEQLDLQIDLVGGDTVGAPAGASFLNVTMWGRTASAPPLTRTGACPGDQLWIDGPLGFAAAGLDILRRFGADYDVAFAPFVAAQLRPTPRRFLASSAHAVGVLSAIDVSDGLARDAGRVAEASGVAIVLDADHLASPALRTLAANMGANAEHWALHGGEDYVKMVSSVQPPDIGWTRVGRVEQGPPTLTLQEADGSRRPLVFEGFEHF